MSGKPDISRLTVQVGKFAVHDVFDVNSYAWLSHDDFFNWSIWAAGAFDYPADKVGLGYGAVVELNQKYWALRVGYFLVGLTPGSDRLMAKMIIGTDLTEGTSDKSSDTSKSLRKPGGRMITWAQP